MSTNTNIDEKMWDIYTHKEEYRKPFLQKAKLWLMHNGYSEECDELGRYIDSLEQDMSENTNNNVNDEKMWDIYIHKEQYGKSLLEEAELWLMCNGYSEECDELGHYIDSLEQDMSEDSDESEDNINSLEQNEYEYIPKSNKIYHNRINHNRIYHGSKSKIWISYLKVTCFFMWFINVVLCMLFGGFFLREDRVYGLVFGALIGFVSGFLILPLIMTFITMCENIATTTDNTAKILMGIDKLKDYYNISD